MTGNDDLGFLTTLGFHFCQVLKQDACILDASGHDCYSALADELGMPVTFEVLGSLQSEQFGRLSDALNTYFETTTVTPAQVARAVAATLAAWR